jgi:hypothetical protein
MTLSLRQRNQDSEWVIPLDASDLRRAEFNVGPISYCLSAMSVIRNSSPAGSRQWRFFGQCNCDPNGSSGKSFEFKFRRGWRRSLSLSLSPPPFSLFLSLCRGNMEAAWSYNEKLISSLSPAYNPGEITRGAIAWSCRRARQREGDATVLRYRYYRANLISMDRGKSNLVRTRGTSRLRYLISISKLISRASPRGRARAYAGQIYGTGRQGGEGSWLIPMRGKTARK